MKHTKYYVITAVGLVLAAIGLYLMKVFTEPQWMVRTLPYLCIGVGCGMFGHGLGDILSRKAIEKDPELARQVDIETKDERNIQHANASKAKAFNMMTYVFGALMLAYALMGAAFEILLPFVVAYLFVQFYAVYHRLKIDKED